MEINQEITEKVEKYLLGDLNENESREFEFEISQNDDLRKEVEHIRLVINGIEYLGDTQLNARLNSIYNSINDQSPLLIKLIVKNKVLAIAASLLLLISTFFVISHISDSMMNSESVYLTYYSTPVYNKITRNNSDESGKSAELFYNRKEFEKAYEIFKDISTLKPNDLSNTLYMAICLNEMGHDSIAAVNLKKIIDHNHPALADDAIWYLGMLYIKQSNTEEAAQYLTKLKDDKSSYYNERAQEILDLKPFSE
jgi:tetratricopeptide (TPR) repeat protein